MDVTIVVVLLFVVSIFTSFGNKGYTPPSAPSSQPGIVYTEISVKEPDSTFLTVAGDNPGPAIQKYIKKYRDNDLSASISNSIMRHSQTYDVNPKLAAALIARESKFNPRALSSSGAIGLGQLMPSTCKGLKIDDPYDTDQNVKGTVRYLKSLLERFKGKVSSALAGYLEGPNAVSQNGGFSNHSKSYVEDILNIYQKI